MNFNGWALRKTNACKSFIFHFRLYFVPFISQKWIYRANKLLLAWIFKFPWQFPLVTCWILLLMVDFEFNEKITIPFRLSNIRSLVWTYCKQHMNIWIYLLVHGIVRVSIVSKRRTFLFNYKPSHKKKCNVLQTWIWSCRHICNGHTKFLFSFPIFELCPYICHQSWSWKHCKVWNEMLLGSMLHMHSSVWINFNE